MIFILKYLIPKGYNGLTMYPFIFLKKEVLKHDVILMNHEKIHLKQQLEMIIIPFYFLYFIEFLFRLLQCKNWKKAYRNISFEREAYANEMDLEYLNNRPLWGFFKYIRVHDFRV